MKRFEFSLATLLNLRDGEEKEWENRLSKITGECDTIRGEMAHCTSERLNCALRNGLGDLASFRAVNLFQKRMDQETVNLTRALGEKMKEREKVLESYIEARKKRMVLEKLKEKQLEEYYTNRRKAEEKQNDDLNNGKWATRVSF